MKGFKNRSLYILLFQVLHLVAAQESENGPSGGSLEFLPLNREWLTNTPQINYDQWIPIQQSPLKNDPTLEYLPPTLHTVYFGGENPSLRPVRPIQPIPASQVIKDDLNPLSQQYFNPRLPPPFLQPPGILPQNDLRDSEKPIGETITTPPNVPNDGQEDSKDQPPSALNNVTESAQNVPTVPEPVTERTKLKYKSDYSKLRERFRPTRPANSKYSLKFPPSSLSRLPSRLNAYQTTTPTTTVVPDKPSTPQIQESSSDDHSSVDDVNHSEETVTEDTKFEDSEEQIIQLDTEHASNEDTVDEPSVLLDDDIVEEKQELQLLNSENDSSTEKIEQNWTVEDSKSQASGIENTISEDQDLGNQQPKNEQESDFQSVRQSGEVSQDVTGIDQLTASQEDTAKDGWVGITFFNSHSRPPKPSENKVNEIPLLSRPLETMTIETLSTDAPKPAPDDMTTVYPEESLEVSAEIETIETSSVPSLNFFDRVTNLLKDVVKETYKQTENLSVDETSAEQDDITNETIISDYGDITETNLDADKEPIILDSDVYKTDYSDKSLEAETQLNEQDETDVFNIKSINEFEGILNSQSDEKGDFPAQYFALNNNDLTPEELDEKSIYLDEDIESNTEKEDAASSIDKDVEQRPGYLNSKLKLKLVHSSDRSDELLGNTAKYNHTRNKIESHKHKVILHTSLPHRSTTFLPKIRPFRPSRRPLSPALQSLVSKSNPSTPRTTTISPSILKIQKKKKITTPRPLKNHPLIIIQGHSNVKLYGANAPKEVTKKPLQHLPSSHESMLIRETTTPKVYSQPLPEEQLEELYIDKRPEDQPGFLNTFSSMLNEFFNNPKPLSKSKLKLVNRPVRQEPDDAPSYVVNSFFDE